MSATHAPPPVALSVRAELDGDALRIAGGALVPDGAWIVYAAYATAEPEIRAVGYARVEAQGFAATIDVADWPAGEIVVDAHFQMLLPGRKQPAAVLDLYGPRGERMTGAHVVEGGADFRAAIASARVVKP